MDMQVKTAQRAYIDAIRAAQPSGVADPNAARFQSEAPVTPSFTETMGEVAEETIDTLIRGETASRDMMAGRAEPHSVVEALAATEVALEMAVSVRDKVVEAYQEILRMPV